MITPKELLTKTKKSFFKIVSARFKGEEVFPWVIPSNKQITGSNYSDWKNDLVPLYQQSKTVKAKGYSVEWKDKNINGSKQSVPAKIYFETFDDFLFFSGKIKEYQKIADSRQLILSQYPSLEQWANDNPAVLLDNVHLWNDL